MLQPFYPPTQTYTQYHLSQHSFPPPRMISPYQQPQQFLPPKPSSSSNPPQPLKPTSMPTQLNPNPNSKPSQLLYNNRMENFPTYSINMFDLGGVQLRSRKALKGLTLTMR